MRRATHLLLGAVAFLAYLYPLDLLLGIPAGIQVAGFFSALVGSLMPDALEPARTASHRGLGHSRKALKGSAELFAVTALLGLFQDFNPALSLACVVSGFFLGYAVHLLADSMTPAGLPG